MKIIKKIILPLILIMSLFIIVLNFSFNKKYISYYDDASSIKEVFLSELNIDPLEFPGIEFKQLYDDFINNLMNKENVLINRDELKKQLINFDSEVFYKETSVEKTIRNSINSFLNDKYKIRSIKDYKVIALIILITLIAIYFLIGYKRIPSFILGFGMMLLVLEVFLLGVYGLSQVFEFNGQDIAIYLNANLKSFSEYILKNMITVSFIIIFIFLLYLVSKLIEKAFIKKKGIVTLDNLFDNYREEEVVLRIKEQKQQDRIERKLKERRKKK